MAIKNDIKSYIIKEGLTITKIKEILNEKNQTNHSVQNLSKKISNETLKYSDVIEIADILGYDIKWEKRKS